ncbi:hypothetical protein WFZ85_10295 [Flavobacterium sp. j3]|uniref:Uncharacterized protein n=1 Tax=Flavobacterium aureirubrum TaxID=3133147 RepID=A0ABU9N6E7_9FLAO
MNERKIYNIIAFYKSTLPINIAISILPLIFGGISFFKTIFLTFGFFAALLIKEVKQKNDYLFYYNNGISKVNLLLFSYVANFLFLILIVIIINLISNIFWQSILLK